mgnify:CR=1 FL=1|tara:strand:- start:29 stop:1048 length:1020 start_codon:yes stop_codon:yes gene_type:complete
MKQYSIINDNDNFIIVNETIDFVLFKSLKKELYDAKNKIDNFINWDYKKKIFNKYEDVYSNNKKKNICLKNPISRSYFKLCEILQDCNINYEYANSLSIAEAPGGFIEYLSEHKLSNNIYANTLISPFDKYVPNWNYKLLKKHNINFLNEKNGNIKDINVINYIYKNINDCDLITADGGIDYSSNYNSQERDSYNLLYSEVLINLICQKENGNFIIKFFDIFDISTIKLIYILYLCYEEIILIKPNTSRPSNSEKYIICKNYIYNNEIIDYMKKQFNTKNLNIKLSNDFIHKIFQYNESFVINQINNINNIINNNIHNYNNNKYCIDWCKKYNMPYKNI